jgi:hypothetical protein
MQIIQIEINHGGVQLSCQAHALLIPIIWMPLIGVWPNWGATQTIEHPGQLGHPSPAKGRVCVVLRAGVHDYLDEMLITREPHQAHTEKIMGRPPPHQRVQTAESTAANAKSRECVSFSTRRREKSS